MWNPQAMWPAIHTVVVGFWMVENRADIKFVMRDKEGAWFLVDGDGNVLCNLKVPPQKWATPPVAIEMRPYYKDAFAKAAT